MEASEAAVLPSEPEAELFADGLAEDVELSTILSDEEDLEAISMEGKRTILTRRRCWKNRKLKAFNLDHRPKPDD
jgi:hypothetical protein